MLNQIQSDVKLSKEFSATFSELKVFHFLKKAGITKSKGASTLTIFTFLFSLIFEGKTLFCTLSNWRSTTDFKKDTVYRFMNNPLNNWRKFLLSVSSFVIGKLHRLTNVTSQARVLIVDDSSFYRTRSKCVENLAWQYDHALHRAYKGFRVLTLGFSDGHSFMPVDFALLSGKNKVGKMASADRRTSGGLREKEAQMTSPTLVVEMVARALSSGIYASHVLMDSWFTFPTLLTQLTEIGTHVIGMVKKSKTKYLYQGKLYRLEDLYHRSVEETCDTTVISSIAVTLQTGVPVRLIFVRNRTKKSAWLAIMTTDMSLSSQEIVKLYGIRWDIETFFKVTKSLLNLTKETQTRNFNGLICHTTIVFIRYISLSWQQRCATDTRTLGGLFYELCDEMNELDWAVALSSLVTLLTELTQTLDKSFTQFFSRQVSDWFDALPSYIKAYLPNLMCES